MKFEKVNYVSSFYIPVLPAHQMLVISFIGTSWVYLLKLCISV